MAISIRMVILAGLLGWGLGLFAQDDDPLLEYFGLVKDGDAVLLNWVTRPGTTCEGVDVERSVDGVSFSSIHHIPGICGGPDEAYSYSHRDEAPVANRLNHYRLVMGRLGHSQSRSIEVVALGPGGLLVRPQPMAATGRVYFENAAAQSCHLRLIGLDGALRGLWETRQEYFEFDAGALPPGLYLLQVVNGEGALQAQGRLLVQR